MCLLILTNTPHSGKMLLIREMEAGGGDERDACEFSVVSLQFSAGLNNPKEQSLSVKIPQRTKFISEDKWNKMSKNTAF